MKQNPDVAFHRWCHAIRWVLTKTTAIVGDLSLSSKEMWAAGDSQRSRDREARRHSASLESPSQCAELLGTAELAVSVGRLWIKNFLSLGVPLLQKSATCAKTQRHNRIAQFSHTLLHMNMFLKCS